MKDFIGCAREGDVGFDRARVALIVGPDSNVASWSGEVAADARFYCTGSDGGGDFVVRVICASTRGSSL